MNTSALEGHPWMANSNSDAIERMLGVAGVAEIGELFEQIPEEHRFRGTLDLPEALVSEAELSRHLRTLLSRNESTTERLSFLGGGCWPHYVPAVVDEVISRTEFVTSIWGTPSSDLGRNQAWFEFCSQLGELLDLDFVGLPVYSYGCAAGHALRMAARITGRSELLMPRSLDPERAAVIRTYAGPTEMERSLDVVEVDCDWETGQVDVADLKGKLNERTAAVYLETPSYLGTIESEGPDIAGLAAEHGALTVVGVDPLSLGVLASPATWGADIVVGTMQPLGVHMNSGGGTGGFIASRDEERYAREYPTLCLTACETVEPGELGFTMTLFEQSSYGSREKGKDWTGNSTYLWAVAGAAYMALLGPRGFRGIGETILARSHYAAERLASLPGIEVRFGDAFFKEFVVDFTATGKSVKEINRGLRDRGIFGGIDLSDAFAELGQSALYCVTEIHTKEDIDRLASAMDEVIA